MRANTRKPLPQKEPPKRGRGRPPHVVEIDGHVIRLHRGRQADYSESTASEILEQLAAGKTLRSICKEPGMPTAATVSRWVTNDTNGFSDRYERARKLQADSLFDETIDISNGEFIDRTEVDAAKLKIDTRFRFLSKLDPARFGDKLEVSSKTEKRTDAELDTQILNLLETADHASLLKQPGTRKLLAKPQR